MSRRPLYRVEIASSLGGIARVDSFVNDTYITHPFASPPNISYPVRVIQALLIRRDMYERNAIHGSSVISSGVVILDNSDGGLDTMLDYAFDGRSLKVYGVNGAVEDLVFSGVIEQVTYNLTELTLQARDVAHLWDVAAQPVKYAGSNVLPNGVEGLPADIKGRPKPIALGAVFNATPPCVNTTRLIYQVSSDPGGLNTASAVFSITVYDKRVALTRGADYVSQADMEATAPAAGAYRLWPAGSMFRLGSTPAGIVTFDLVNPPFGFTPASTGQMSTLLQGVVASAGLSYPSLGLLESTYLSNNPTGGIYTSDERTVLDCRKEIAQGLGIFTMIGWDPKGYGFRIVTSQLQSPTSALVPVTPVTDAPGVLALDESSILSASLMKIVPSGSDRGLPVWRVNVNYAKNYTVMSPTDVAGSVTIADRAFVAREYRTVTSSDAAVLTNYPYAAELNINSLIAYQADAQTECDRLLALFKVRRDMLVLTIPGELARAVPAANGETLFRLAVMSLVTVTHRRFGLSTARKFIVIGIQENFSQDTVELTVWG